MEINKTLPGIDMEEVPTEIWDGVREKWIQALINGWNEERLWNGCDLCTWCNSVQCGCHRCPLRSDGWCTNSGKRSKLNYNYRMDYSDKKRLYWEERVREFIKFIDPYCKHDVPFGYYD